MSYNFDEWTDLDEDFFTYLYPTKWGRHIA